MAPAAVLETAAGSGALTRALAPRLNARTRYCATEWRQADALAPAGRRSGPSAGRPSRRPCFLARTPHGYHDTAQIRADLQRAGFPASHIDIETRSRTSLASSARDAALACCHGTPLRNEIEARDAGLLPEAIERAARAIAARHGEGPVSGRIQAHLVVARA